MTTRLLDQLRDADPARRLEGYDDAYLRATAHTISSVAPDTSTASLPRRPLSRRLALLAPVAAAAAAALIIGPAMIGAPSASAEAAAALNGAADHVTAVDPSADPEDWWEVRTTGFHLGLIDLPAGQVAILVSGDRSVYHSVDGSGPSYFEDGPASLVRQVAGAPVTSTDLEGWLNVSTEAWTSDLAPKDTPGTWGSPNPAFLAELPRETSALRERLYDDSTGGGNSADGIAFEFVADLLKSGVVPADLRSALYRVLATIPGVEVTAQSATVGTASGVAFGRYESQGGTRSELVIDPTTGDLVGAREILTHAQDGIPAGTAIGETVVTRVLVHAVPPDLVEKAEVWDCNVAPDGATACSIPLPGRG